MHDLQMIGQRDLLCGLHVHVELPDADERVDVMYRMLPYLPLFLALSTSSPFWQSRRTGLKGYRLAAYDELPRTGVPELFRTREEFDAYVAALVRSGVIEDSSFIWWAIRPSLDNPTLELRAPDSCTLVEDSIAIAALYRTLMRHLYVNRWRNADLDAVQRAIVVENKWQAQRHGVHATFVTEEGAMTVADMLERVIGDTAADAAALGCGAEIAAAAPSSTPAPRRTPNWRCLRCTRRQEPRRRAARGERMDRRSDLAVRVHRRSATFLSSSWSLALSPRRRSNGTAWRRGDRVSAHETAADASRPPTLKRDWRFYLGMAAIVLAVIMPLCAVLCAIRGLQRRTRPFWSAYCVAGGPEVLCILAVALLGKETFQYFTHKAKSAFRRALVDRPASKGRYYFGLTIVLVSWLPAYLYALFPRSHARRGVPASTFSPEWTWPSSQASSSWVGEFWEKVRRVFIYEGKI